MTVLKNAQPRAYRVYPARSIRGHIDKVQLVLPEQAIASKTTGIGCCVFEWRRFRVAPVDLETYETQRTMRRVHLGNTRGVEEVYVAI